MLDPWRGPFETVTVIWNGNALGNAERIERPDVGEQFYWMRNGAAGGVRVTVPEHDADGVLQLVCWRRGRPAASLRTTFVAPHLDGLPLPPDALARRVSEFTGDAFRLSGLRLFTDTWDQIGGNRQSLRILDWGCGCGRVARHLARVGVAALHGCDIDPEAIAWCAANLPGTYQACGVEPRLPYADGSIDVVIAASVFTHLDRDRQARWLEDICRVLAPGGLLLASVAGRDVILAGRSNRFTTARPGSLPTRAVAIRKVVKLARAGILDSHIDEHLDGIAPPGYYRMTYQNPRYTAGVWSRWFDIIEQIQRGLGGHQDLVVMRRRASPD